MTNLQSENKIVQLPAGKLMALLSDFENFRKLLPEDKIENFECGENFCRFRIKGLTDLGLSLDPTPQSEKVRMISHGKVPFPFTMDFNVKALNEKESDVQIDFSGDINPFLKMMVEKPLQNFLNILLSQISTLE